MSDNMFFFGDWQINPESNSLRCGDVVKQLEPKAMDVLLLLCQSDGDVLSSDDIVKLCWGDIPMGDNPVHKAITQLRKALGDKATAPTYIETIRKRGYRTLASVEFPLGHQTHAEIASWQGESPFPGLRPYQAKDAQVFFGRSAQISTLLGRIAEQVKFGRAFCLLLGPSGSGKSSLVNAGVLPNLMGHNGYDGIGVCSHTTLDLADVSKDRLMTDLASAMLDWDINDEPVFDGFSADRLAALLEEDIDAVIKLCKAALLSTNLAASLTSSSENTDTSTAPCHATYATPLLALFVDRLEVLLSSPQFSQPQREAFVALLETLANSGAILVLSACRNDFYPSLVNYPSLMAGKSSGAHFDLAPPTRAELLQMIRLPASAAGLSWQQDNTSAMGLDELLCVEAASNPDALPMLQYTLQELYLQRSESGELKLEVFRALGGIEGSIGKKAQEVTSQLSQADNASLAKVLSLLVTLSLDESNITSRAARWSQLEDKHQVALVKAMVESRLFVSHLQNGEPCFSVAHEALLRRWDKAKLWIDDHLDSLSIKSRIHHLAKRWRDEAKGKAYLLAEGKPLQEAVALSSNPLFSLDNQEQGFIQTSIKRAQIKRWTRRITISLLCLLSFTSVLMSLKSLDAEQQALEKRLEAENLLGFMVGDFADKLRSVGRMDLLDGISNKALEYFSRDDANPESKSNANSLLPHWLSTSLGFTSSKASFEARFQHAQTLEAMGEVAYSRGKLDEAIKAFEAAKLLLDKLYTEDKANPTLLKVLGANAFWLGQIPYAQSNWPLAEKYLTLYRDYSDALMTLTPDDVDAWVELSYALNSLGSLALKQLDYQAANTAFNRSLSLKTQALVKDPKNDYLRSDRADTLNWLAKINIPIGNIDEALTLYNEAQLELEMLLTKANDDANLMSRLSYIYTNQAQLLRYQSKFEQATVKAKKSAQLLKKALKQDPSNEQWKSDLTHVRALSLGIRTHAPSFLMQESDALFQQQINTINATLLDTSSKIKAITIELEIIRSLQKTKALSEAEILIEQVEQQLNSIANVRSRDYVISNVEFSILKAYQLQQQAQAELSLALCQNTIDELAPIIQETTEIQLILAFVQANSCVGKTKPITQEWLRLQSMGISGKGFIFIE
ncbi:transcriptional regulatory protein-like protein [Shewanella denitrificans OS217]|jgi:eukaryotic-like serine/threonine-protein kinase|uniref:Transcriptional regulatory protein-like protein n=1 Tax=Shewanella denitrificans (strain OS217 / ATCC BAA-1090 / DSM 15013) TaxID=318161 RepID=Q12QP4_SHEDO|nr:winged helix-turn-helix domain-containing protein [Shewanella denitrificans]ABE54232.1 transcriptional regulatory protein-like protein [Shewanella denitrificans OS217]